MDPKSQGSIVWKLMQYEPGDVSSFSEFLEERQQAEQRIGATLSELVESRTLSVFEAARTYAAAVASIVGYDELIATHAPGPSASTVGLGIFGRQPASVS